MQEKKSKIIPTKEKELYFAVTIKQSRYCTRLKIYVNCRQVNGAIKRNTAQEIISLETAGKRDAIEKACRIILNRTNYMTKTPIRKRIVDKNEAYQSY